jgi:hypothetical protein
MKSTMKANKELDLNFIDSLQDELADMAVSGGAGAAVGKSDPQGLRERSTLSPVAADFRQRPSELSHRPNRTSHQPPTQPTPGPHL